MFPYNIMYLNYRSRCVFWCDFCFDWLNTKRQRRELMQNIRNYNKNMLLGI